jgi:outer membrane lipoprotein LolB
MSRIIFRVSLILLLITVTACKPIWYRAPKTPEGMWQQRSPDLMILDKWAIKGRSAIVQGEEGWNVGLKWRQSLNNYQINLTGPFAQGGVVLTGDGKKVTLFLGDGQQISSSSPEALLEEHMNLKIPVSALRDWVRGLPYKNLEVDKVEYDSEGRITYLEQQDWQLKFLRYVPFEQYEMPAKIFIAHPGLSLKFIIQDWETVK